jgi:FixJ family two-component response regulator
LRWGPKQLNCDGGGAAAGRLGVTFVPSLSTQAYRDPSADSAIRRPSRSRAALLDANLHGNPVGEIAAALTRRRIPFIFVTGYGRESLPEFFKHAAILTKPFTDKQLFDAVTALASPTNVTRLKA